MTLYRERATTVDAFKWTADETQTEDPVWIKEALELGREHVYGAVIMKSQPFGCCMSITVPSGTAVAVPGDYVIRGAKGELFTMKPDAFAAKYEVAV